MSEPDDDLASVQWGIDLARFVQNPLFVGMAFCALLGLAGVAAIVVSGLGIGDHRYVSLQVPYLVSGGVGALGLIGAGVFLASVLGSRRDSAEADRELGELVTQVAAVARLAAARRSS